MLLNYCRQRLYAIIYGFRNDIDCIAVFILRLKFRLCEIVFSCISRHFALMADALTATDGSQMVAVRLQLLNQLFGTHQTGTRRNNPRNPEHDRLRQVLSTAL